MLIIFLCQKKNFQTLKKKNKFLETAKVYDNYYGTLNSEIKKNLKKNRIILFDVDWQGSKTIKKNIKSNCFSFFLLPPSISVLKKRLLKRHKDNQKVALQRFSSAKKDISHWKEYDYIFINKNLDVCMKEIINKINYLSKEKKRNIEINKIIKKL